MKISGNENNTMIIQELGKRIQAFRINMNLTQDDVARLSGVALSTIIRIEKGESSKFDNILNILRVLKLIPNIDLLVPEQEIKPTEIIDSVKQRKRVRKNNSGKAEPGWIWGEDQ